MRRFTWGVGGATAIARVGGVGEVVPGAEDPCYGAPPGLAYSFCRDQHAHPEKWAKWQAEWKKRTRPELHLPEEMNRASQEQHAAELAEAERAASLPWYDRPLVTRPHGGLTEDPIGKVGSVLTPKRLAIAGVLAYLGSGALT